MKKRTWPYGLLVALGLVLCVGLGWLRIDLEQTLLAPKQQNIQQWQRELRQQASEQLLFHPQLFPQFANIEPESIEFDADDGEAMLEEYVDYWFDYLQQTLLSEQQRLLAQARLFALNEDIQINPVEVPLAVIWFLFNEELPDMAHQEMEQRSEMRFDTWPEYNNTSATSESQRLAYYFDSDDVLATPNLCLLLADPQQQLLRDNVALDASEALNLPQWSLWTSSGRALYIDHQPPYCSYQLFLLTDGGYLWLGLPAQQEILLLQRIQTWQVGLTACTLLLCLTLAWWLSHRRRQQQKQLQHSLASVADGHLDQRLSADHAPDFANLVIVINSILDNVQRISQQAQWMSDTMAHDLKSPITRARGQLELLLNMERPDKHTIEAIIQEHDDITHCFNALLRISQIERSQYKVSGRQFDFTEIIATLVEIFEPSAEEKRQNLSYQIDHCNLEIEGDKNQWLQAVSNLLDNAIKYTPEGGKIIIRARSTTYRQRDVIELTVCDSGMGIPEHEQASVLQRFYRLHEHATSKGHGLGLSLVQAVCQHHQAKLSLSNHCGLVVTIFIPKKVS